MDTSKGRIQDVTRLEQLYRPQSVFGQAFINLSRLLRYVHVHRQGVLARVRVDLGHVLDRQRPNAVWRYAEPGEPGLRSFRYRLTQRFRVREESLRIRGHKSRLP